MSSSANDPFAFFPPTSNDSLSVASFSYLNGVSTAVYRSRLNESVPTIGYFRVSEVLSSLESNLICSICSGVDLNIVDAGCGNSHYFCKECISDWITRNPVCPHCQCSISSSSLCDPPESLYESLLSAEVLCNCQAWQGPFARLPAHLGYCHAVTISCSYATFGCNDRFSADAASSHETATVATHLSFMKNAFEKLEKRVSTMQEQVTSLQQHNETLTHILLETNPKEYCLYFHEPLPRLFAVGRSLPFYGIVIEEYNYQKHSWEVLCPLPSRGNIVSRFTLSILPTNANTTTVDILIVGGSEMMAFLENKGVHTDQRQTQHTNHAHTTTTNYNNYNYTNDRTTYWGENGGGIASSVASNSTTVSSYRNGSNPTHPPLASFSPIEAYKTIYRNDVYKYNITSNSLIKLPALTHSRLDPIVVPLNNIIYVFGGVYEESILTSFEVLRPASSTWRIYNYPPSIAMIYSAIAYKERIFVLHRLQKNPYLESIEGRPSLRNNSKVETSLANCYPDMDLFTSCLPFARRRSTSSHGGRGEGPFSRSRRQRREVSPSPFDAYRLSEGFLASEAYTNEDRFPVVTSVESSNTKRRSCCAVIHPSEDVGTRLGDVANAWQKVTFAYCDKAVLLAVMDDLLYMLCEHKRNGQHYSFSVQQYNDTTAKFEDLDNVGNKVMLQKFSSIAKCGISLKKELGWIGDIAASRDHALAIWEA